MGIVGKTNQAVLGPQTILVFVYAPIARLPRAVQEPPQTGRNLRGLAGTHQQRAIPQAPEHEGVLGHL
ncbi:hypothetical protein C0674_01595 [Sporolactobacillus terrae]|uniref:Uncharacterized protein n=1 Tax=Sporolactobacillus terrae TaxID=269673 RepID=A0ABX5Q458_9BACL|nr:hypothetical protein C0674_01595 [Sporolactobacillus terrae]QAA24396.1 hypothetical protein C0679_01575 [Sporolactobacillus terrae]